MEEVRKKTNMGWPEENALWWYTVIPEPQLSNKLEQLSHAKSYGDTDAITFQPCPNPEEKSQDRFVIKQWPFADGTWSFRAVFDGQSMLRVIVHTIHHLPPTPLNQGHAGHETADYVAATLPGRVQDALEVLLSDEGHPPDSTAVGEMLKNTIAKLDHDIGAALLALFPDSVALEGMTDEHIRNIINVGRPNSDVVLRCMRGTTALVSLVDPKRENIWVASLGDCAAVLGTRKTGGGWETRVLSEAHNGDNPVEVARVCAAHPGEAECVLHNRVLGAIAVTRALGDFSFKLPAIYTHRVLLNARPGFLVPAKVEEFTARNHTPPYMSGVPAITHVALGAEGAHDAFLILCSDGLTDVNEESRLQLNETLAPHWVDVVGKHYRAEDSGAAAAAKPPNLALALLRDAIGGDDIEKVSRHITVEMIMRWMDDTTVLVQRLL
ncbi:protein serine/threonine phosphatase 2C [Pholiota conissans]|uniref:Protein serine/threonine phosphatase 2C n=1 Tax=Pholiota conissans TaxID=109636 RepID=A0A9P6CYU0_9AGAR|nr:protein serine/threonine phosphatase 2C [Pholiota conissans]